ELEPIGAALAYGQTSQNEEIVLVFDFGGGTLDISIVSYPSGKILGVTGVGIGGDLIDIHIFQNKLLKYFGGQSKFGLHQTHLPKFIVNALQNWYSLSLLKTQDFLVTLERLTQQTDDKFSMKNLESLVLYNLGFALYEDIDRVKKQLSQTTQENFSFNQQSIQINEVLTRLDLQEIMYPLLVSIEECIDESLKVSGINVSKIDKVVMTGGSSLIPRVKEILAAKFGGEKISQFDVFESVVTGLGIKSSQLWP
ncbi:MAG: Hsp70 family protein, partial [Candidatus Amesbacteria bacterium]|nr:Hsp70 family protein [Candidatus Amesbacteria bacterium]